MNEKENKVNKKFNKKPNKNINFMDFISITKRKGKK